VGYGVQVHDSAADDLGAVLQAWQLALPYWSSFTGLTDAQHRGWWLPPLPAGLPLFVAGGRSDVIRRSGLRVCRHDVRPAAERVGGVRVTTAAETVLSLARDLSLLDVVVIGDGALHAGDVTMDELERTARQRRRGAPLLRRAIPLMDGRAESIYEGLFASSTSRAGSRSSRSSRSSTRQDCSSPAPTCGSSAARDSVSTTAPTTSTARASVGT
jgi:hypothetical protein